jgi:hypothetical protein
MHHCRHIEQIDFHIENIINIPKNKLCVSLMFPMFLCGEKK